MKNFVGKGSEKKKKGKENQNVKDGEGGRYN